MALVMCGAVVPNAGIRLIVLARRAFPDVVESRTESAGEQSAMNLSRTTSRTPLHLYPPHNHMSGALVSASALGHMV